MPNHLFRSIAFITSIGDIAHVAVASFRFFWNLDLPGVAAKEGAVHYLQSFRKSTGPINKSIYQAPKTQPLNTLNQIPTYKTDIHKKTSTVKSPVLEPWAASHGR